MKQFSRITFIVLITTILRLFAGCCSCNDQYYNFDYVSMLIKNIDNSGQWSKPSESNKMPAAGVAFEVEIMGSDPISNQNISLASLGFTASKAESCNCEDLYIPNHAISSIKIRTLIDLNADYCCNDEVTELFLANSCLDCDDIGNFYVTMEELVHRINPDAFYQTPINKFLLYLKVPVESSQARFEIEIGLENGTSIIGQTALIEII